MDISRRTFIASGVAAGLAASVDSSAFAQRGARGGGAAASPPPVVPIEQEQNTAAGPVGEGGQVIENRRRASIHPSNRMKGYYLPTPRSTTKEGQEGREGQVRQERQRGGRAGRARMRQGTAGS